MKKSKGKMKVRHYIWRPTTEGARTEIYHQGKWLPCASIAAARGCAKMHGYSGIVIQVEA